MLQKLTYLPKFQRFLPIRKSLSWHISIYSLHREMFTVQGYLKIYVKLNLRLTWSKTSLFIIFGKVLALDMYKHHLYPLFLI